MTAPAPPRRVMATGVDAVTIERAVTMLRRSSDLLPGRVLTWPEADWAGHDAVRLATALAAKECAIKAAGGRPPGFSWQDAVLDPALASALDPGLHPEQQPADLVLGQFARDAHLDGVRRFGCTFRGATAAALTAALRPSRSGPAAHPVHPMGAVCAGVTAGHLLAALVVWLGASW